MNYVVRGEGYPGEQSVQSLAEMTETHKRLC